MDYLHELYCEILHDGDYGADPAYPPTAIKVVSIPHPENVLTWDERKEFERWLMTLDCQQEEQRAA